MTTPAPISPPIKIYDPYLAWALFIAEPGEEVVFSFIDSNSNSEKYPSRIVSNLEIASQLNANAEAIAKNEISCAFNFSKVEKKASRDVPSEQPTIGVIDFGCAFLNPEFFDSNKRSRIVRLWDQDSTQVETPNFGPDRYWNPSKWGYGRVLSRTDLEEITAKFNGQPEKSQLEIYRELDYLIEPESQMVFQRTHGTHVLGLAAGRTPPQLSLDGLATIPAEDAASNANIVFVQLPLNTFTGSARGSLGKFILDGIHFIIQQCQPPAPLVINISYGAFAGPHDGSSALERALDNISIEERKRRHGKFAIVLAAGNSALAQCHDVQCASSNDEVLSFTIKFSSARRTPILAEFWLQKSDFRQPELFLKGQRISLRASDFFSDTFEFDEAPKALKGILSHPEQVPNTDKNDRKMILLAIAPGGDATDEQELTLVFNGCEKGTEIQGWIETDSSTYDRANQATFVEPHVPDINSKLPWNTLSSFATGRQTFVVGAKSVITNERIDYSGWAHPQGREDFDASPTYYAPAEIDSTRPGLMGPAIMPFQTWRMNGTSVAAPTIAREIFNFFCQESHLSDHLQEKFGIPRLQEK